MPPLIDATELLVWQQALPGTEIAVLPPSNSRSNPVIAEKRLLACTFSPGAVHCLDAASGHPIWQFELHGLGGSSVLVSHGLVYAKTARTLYALRIADGELVWKFTPHRGAGEHMYSAPVVSGEHLFIGDRAGTIHCLDASTGVPRWTSTVARGNVNSTLLVVDDRVVAGTNDSTAVAVDAATGALIWRTSLDEPSIHEVMWDGAVLIHTETLWWLNPRDGTVEDRWAPRGETAESVAMADDTVVALLRQEALVGFRARREVYRIDKQGSFSGVLSFSPATRCVYDARIGEFHIVDPANGTRLCSLKHGELGFAATHPCAVDGHLYVLTHGGDVLALRHPAVAASAAI